MAKLDLKTDRLKGDKIRVSWRDIAIRERTGGTNALIALVALGGLLFCATMALTNGGLTWILVWLGSLVALMVFLRQNVETTNAVIFSPAVTRIGEQSIPTDQITRIEMGPEAQLLGAIETKPCIGDENAANQTIIRAWINDSAAVRISKNNWQNQINHEIRDTLAKALDGVRKENIEVQKAEKYGDQGDFGVPDY